MIDVSHVCDIAERIEKASLRAEEIAKNIMLILKEMQNLEDSLEKNLNE